MALVDNAWYVNYGNGTSTGYYAVAQWAALTVYAAGALVRQLAAPAVGSERVFVCIIAGTSLAAEPTWTTTRGAKTAEASGPTWQECTGIAALNGDATNTPSWTITTTPPGGVKNTAVTLGQVIKRDNGASYQICTTAGTAGNGAEPGFSNTAGTTTADNTVTWTSLGVVGNFTGWQAPHARLNSAYASTWGQAGNSFFVASEHAETQTTAITFADPGTGATPCYVYCVTKTTVPPVSANITTGATITTTGASSIGFANTAGMYYTGISFSAGDGSSLASITWGASSHNYFHKNCSFTIGNSNASSRISNNGGGAAGGLNLLCDGCTFTFGSNASQGFGGTNVGALTVFRNCTITGGATLPTTVFLTSGGNNILQGCDLSAFGSGKTIVGSSSVIGFTYLIDCKLGASVTAAASPGSASQKTYVIRSDSSGVNYRAEKYESLGTQTVETTIVRTGGATDGTTPISWKLVSGTNARWVFPFESLPTTIWNDSTSAITTLTFYGTTTGGGVPNNDDIWVEAEYLGSGSTPLGSFITTTKADNLAASVATNNSSDGSTWGGGGAGNGFKIVVPSFTPAMAGPVNIVVKVGKASATYYIDPKPSISGVTVSKSEILAPGVYANELSSGSSGGGSRARGFAGFS